MKFLLVTPPFTQLNTTYPATAYLKGFLNTIDIPSFQIDLGLEVILEIFCKPGLTHVFAEVENTINQLTENAKRILALKHQYISTIDTVIQFLQNKNQTLAHTICKRDFLPEASRFHAIEDLDWAFGTLGTHDKARHLATLYLEDLGDFISETIDPHFGFSRYAERLSRTASTFDGLYDEIQSEESIIVGVMLQLLEDHITEQDPSIIAITAPFPGNVFAAFKCGQFIKQEFPHIKVIFGGGYANTELRRLADERVFECVDFITLDDGEAPLQHLIQYLSGNRSLTDLKRTFVLNSGVVSYINGSAEFDIPQKEVGTPDYSDLLLDQYLSVIEVANPMHRLWSDGRWNKLTLAHGCYWGKCSFCDVSLDYIKRYEPIQATLICDRIEQIINQTGQNGFHFVDEAAPPALMRDVALEILRREIKVVWWANIRFENRFTPDLCRLLSASGCIAISGGLEVASDRLLVKMKKGVSVSQVARVAKSFTDANIMVHTYLMYGFPTQTAQETMDSLEMVRQMFRLGIIQSGFWHQFAMTAHSPVGIDPGAFDVQLLGPTFGGFAENDLFHKDIKGANHEIYSDGLAASIFNYMNGLGLDESTDIWFDFKTPKVSIAADYISSCLLLENEIIQTNDLYQLVWIGGKVLDIRHLNQKKSNKSNDDITSYSEINMVGQKENYSLFFQTPVAIWLVNILDQAQASGTKTTWAEFRQSYLNAQLTNFDDFVGSENFDLLKKKGLLIV